jgi:hypothetical protein
MPRLSKQVLAHLRLSFSRVLRAGLDKAGSEPQGVSRARSISIIRMGQAIKDRY